MRLVSFDAFRTLGIPSITHLKPEQMFRDRQLLTQADWVLYPQYWQVNALTYGLRTRIFPNQATYHLGHNKIEMTRLFEMICPEHIPLTLILANTLESRLSALEQLDLPFVAKEVKSSMGQGVYLIQNKMDFERYCQQVETLYLQEYLPIDRDLRLILIGERVVGGYWRVRPDGGFHNNVAQGGEILYGPIPDAARQLVERVAQQSGINHAGFDVAMVDGHPYLLEFNRLFGNQGLKQLGLDVPGLILDYLRQQNMPPCRPPLLEMPA
jgi:ribosomal protein S6--L-glutamate ligase